MANVDIKKIVSKTNVATFEYYRAGNMYYQISTADTNYRFPVPMSDIGDATFNKEETSVMMMRYVRAAINDGNLVVEAKILS